MKNQQREASPMNNKPHNMLKNRLLYFLIEEPDTTIKLMVEQRLTQAHLLHYLQFCYDVEAWKELEMDSEEEAVLPNDTPSSRYQSSNSIAELTRSISAGIAGSSIERSEEASLASPSSPALFSAWSNSSQEVMSHGFSSSSSNLLADFETQSSAVSEIKKVAHQICNTYLSLNKTVGSNSPYLNFKNPTAPSPPSPPPPAAAEMIDPAFTLDSIYTTMFDQLVDEALEIILATLSTDITHLLEAENDDEGEDDDEDEDEDEDSEEKDQEMHGDGVLTRKSLEIPYSALDTYIQDYEGKVINFGEYINCHNAKLMIVLLRQYQCPSTRKIVYEIKQLQPVLMELGFSPSFLFIGSATKEESNIFSTAYKDFIDFQNLYQDPSLSIYKKLGCKKKTNTHAKGRKALKGIMKMGYSSSNAYLPVVPGGNQHQLGGVWVCENGKVIFEHKETYKGDCPSFYNLLTVCGANDEVIENLRIKDPNGKTYSLKKTEKGRKRTISKTAKKLRHRSMVSVRSKIVGVGNIKEKSKSAAFSNEAPLGKSISCRSSKHQKVESAHLSSSMFELPEVDFSLKPRKLSFSSKVGRKSLRKRGTSNDSPPNSSGNTTATTTTTTTNMLTDKKNLMKLPSPIKKKVARGSRDWTGAMIDYTRGDKEEEEDDEKKKDKKQRGEKEEEEKKRDDDKEKEKKKHFWLEQHKSRLDREKDKDDDKKKKIFKLDKDEKHTNNKDEEKEKKEKKHNNNNKEEEKIKEEEKDRKYKEEEKDKDRRH